MPLINADNTGATSANVTEHGLNDLQADAKLLQPGSNSAAKVMRYPRRDTCDLVKTPLRYAPTLNRAPAGESENKIAVVNPRHPLKHSPCCVRQGNSVGLPVLCASPFKVNEVARHL